MLLWGNISFAEGHFAWTRELWEGTKNLWGYGVMEPTRIEKEYGANGPAWGVQGTRYVVVEVAGDVTNFLDKYVDSERRSELMEGYGAHVKDSLKELVQKPWGHVVHKFHKVGEIAIENHNNAADSRLTQMNGYLYPVAYALNTTRTALHSAIVLGAELPLEFTGSTLYHLGDVSGNVLRPLEPAASALGETVIATPAVLIFGVGMTTFVGSSFMIFTGLAATIEAGVEAGSWVVKLGEPSAKQSSQKSENTAMLLIPLPQNEAVEQNLNQLFVTAQSQEELQSGFDAAVAKANSQGGSKDKWAIYGQIVSRLDATIQGLEAALKDKPASEQAQILSEWDELYSLKLTYAGKAEHALASDLGELASLTNSPK